MARRETNERPKWLNPDNSYDLLVPVAMTIGEAPERITRVQLRRLNGADLLVLDEPGVWQAKLFTILENMTGLMRVVVLKLDAVDLDRIDDILGYFREPGSVTGVTS